MCLSDRWTCGQSFAVAAATPMILGNAAVSSRAPVMSVEMNAGFRGDTPTFLAFMLAVTGLGPTLIGSLQSSPGADPVPLSTGRLGQLARG
jgi:hypothetical protein